MQYPTEIELNLIYFAGFKEQKITVIYSIERQQFWNFW